MVFAFDILTTTISPAAHLLVMVGFLVIAHQGLKILGPLGTIERLGVMKRIRFAVWLMGAGLALLLLLALWRLVLGLIVSFGLGDWATVMFI